MYKGILLAWITGIACMGLALSQVWSYVSFICLGLFITSYFLIKHTSYRKIMMLLCLMPISFYLAYSYAQQQLTERLKHQEVQIKNTQIIVYIDEINKITNHAIIQKAQILSGFQTAKTDLSQVTYWSLRLPLNQFNHNPLLKDYRDELDETNVSGELNAKSHQTAKLEHLQLGQYYRVTGQIRPNHSYANTGSFDSEQWLVQQNIMSGFKVTQVEPLTREDILKLGFHKHEQQQQSWTNQLRLAVEQMRLDIRQYIINKPLTHKGLILALLTGDRSLLNDETERQFQTLGISHLLAISGPHVLILGAMMMWVLNKLIIHYRPTLYLRIARPYVLCVPFIVTVLFYTAFVGFEIPALRTLLMSSVITLLLLFNRQLNAMSVLLISASILLLFDPFSSLSASFWLSFGASFILLRVYQTLTQDQVSLDEQVIAQQTIWDKVKVAGWTLMTSQWKIFIALLPLVMIFFQKVSWLSPLINIVSIPILGLVVVPLNIIASLAYFIYADLGYVIWLMVDYILSLFLFILQTLSGFLSIELTALAFTPMMVILLMVALILFFLPQNVLPKSWIVLCAMVMGLLTWQKPSFELHVLDVGQGQAIFIQAGRHTTLIDTGGYYDEDRFSIGQNVVVPFLLRQGVKQLNDVILSHLDHDHSGALPYIVRDIQVNNIISNEKLQGSDYMAMVEAEAKTNIHHELCQAGQHWTPSEYTTIRVYAPQMGLTQQQIRQNRNENSCVIHINTLDKSGIYQNFLIMGDAGHSTEQYLMQHYPDIKVDVLILGHHGSKHSTSAEFLDFYKPKLAIASAGYNNRYRHPHHDVVTLLKQRNIPLMTTIQNGTISFKFVQGNIQIEEFRDSRLWLKYHKETKY